MMAWGCAHPREQENGPIEGRAFTIRIDISHETREKAIRYLQYVTREISEGLTDLSDHPCSEADDWSGCFPEGFVSCRWRDFVPEYGIRKEL